MNTFAIIPSLSALGPLGLLALFAPAAFAALMLWMNRWKAALGAASVMSTVWLTQGWWQRKELVSWANTRVALWLTLAAIAAVFTLWAAWRYCRVRQYDVLSRGSVFSGFLALAVAVPTAAVIGGIGKSIDVQPFELYAFLMGIVATIGWLFVTWRFMEIRFSGETVLLAATAGACAAIGLIDIKKKQPLEIEWVFQPDDPGSFLGSPCLDPNLKRVYVAAAHQSGFGRWGAVYAVDSETGKEVWRFTDNGSLKPIFSSPCVFSGKLYFGEGLHSDNDCRLFCLDSNTGAKLWDYKTAGHVESSPVVRGGRVYFGAGDDGLHCLDAESGVKFWQLSGYHIDATPLVFGDMRVFVGSCSTSGSRFRDLRLLAADAKSGQIVWNEPAELSCLAKPNIRDGAVYFCLGSGDLESSGSKPAGALVVLDYETGNQLWRADFPDSVVARSLVDSRARSLVACRDGVLYECNKEEIKKHRLGEPMLASPLPLGTEDQTYAIAIVTRNGRCIKFDAYTLQIKYENDLVRALGGTAGMFIARPTSIGYTAGPIYVAGSVTFGIVEKPCLFRLTDRF